MSGSAKLTFFVKNRLLAAAISHLAAAEGLAKI